MIMNNFVKKQNILCRMKYNYMLFSWVIFKFSYYCHVKSSKHIFYFVSKSSTG
jgi:hypothetical protein